MFDPNVPQGKSTSINDPEFTIPRTNELLRELIGHQKLLAEQQQRAAEQQERAAAREQRIFWVALATLLVTTVGVVATILVGALS